MKLPSISTDNIRLHSSIGRPLKELSKRLMHRPHNEAPVSANLFWKGSLWKSVRLFQFVRPAASNSRPETTTPTNPVPITHAQDAPDTRKEDAPPINWSTSLGTFARLPTELRLKIFNHLSPADLLKVYGTSRGMRMQATEILRLRAQEKNADIGRIESLAQGDRAGAFNTALVAIKKNLPSTLRREPLEHLAARLIDIKPTHRGRCLNSLYRLTSTLPVREQCDLVNQSAYHVFSLQREDVDASLAMACNLIRHFPDDKKKEAANSLKEQLRGAVIWYKRTDLDNKINALIGGTSKPSFAGVHHHIHSDKVTVFDNALAAIGNLPPAVQHERLACLTDILEFVPTGEQGRRLNRLYELTASMPLAKQPSHFVLHSYLFSLPSEDIEESFNKACDLIRGLPDDTARRKSIAWMKAMLRGSDLDDKQAYLARIDDPNFWQPPATGRAPSEVVRDTR